MAADLCVHETHPDRCAVCRAEIAVLTQGTRTTRRRPPQRTPMPEWFRLMMVDLFGYASPDQLTDSKDGTP